MLVRFLAVALMCFSLAEVALAFAVQAKIPVEVLPCVLKSLPAVVGVVMLIKARALAEWLANLLDN